MGSVIKQLSDELNQRQRELRYGLAKGALVGAWLAVVAGVVLLWKRPVALTYFVSLVLSLALFNMFWLLPLVVTVFLVGFVVFDTVTTNGQRLYSFRSRIRARRHRIGVNRGWKNAMSDLGLTSKYDRRGSAVIAYPKLQRIEERK